MTTPERARTPVHDPAPRWFADRGDVPRSRRSTDAVAAAVATAGLALLTAIESPAPGAVRAVSDAVARLPEALTTVWQLLADLVIVFAVLTTIGFAVARRWTIARDVVVAALVALVIGSVVARLATGEPVDLGRALGRAAPPPWYPVPRLALAAAVVMTAAPHLAVPVRRLGRWLLGAGALAVVALGAGSVTGTVAGLLVAMLAAASIHLVFGSAAGRPGLQDVRAALAELGVRATDLHVASDQRAGVFTVDGCGEGPDGGTGPLVVKVYGRDAHGAAVLSTAWRTLWLREPGPPAGFGRLQQVEHEAFLTLLAERDGVGADRVLVTGTTSRGDALVALRPGGVAVTVEDEVGVTPDGTASDRTVEALWHAVDALHRTGVVHGHVDVDRIRLLPGTSPNPVRLTDFRTARVDRSDAARGVDRAQAFATSVRLVGPDRAITLARSIVGPESTAAFLPYVQAATLTRDQRAWFARSDDDLGELRARAAEAVGVELPAEVELRRFTFGSILRVALPVVALFALASAVAGLDGRALLEELADARWWLVLLGVIVAQLPRLTQAVSTLGASPVTLPLGPVYALQLAVSYVNLAVPTSAARMAINIRFFQRHGVPPGGAIAAGAIDGFGGFVVQLGLLVSFVLLGPVSLELELDAPASGAPTRLLLLVLVVGLGALGILVVARRLRRFVLGWARRLVVEGIEALRGLGSRRRLGLLVGGNLATEVLFASALGVFVAAFGVRVGLGELLLVVIAVSLLAGLLPVPGGIGVTEGGLVFGLVAIGVPEERAFAAVICYRLATFYLPPAWGFVALRWLERNDHL